MAEFNLTLTADEQQHLAGLLEMALKDKRVEEHRTRTPSYREQVIQEEVLVQSILKKLGSVAR